MWTLGQIVIEIVDVDGSDPPPVALIEISTPAGVVECLGELSFAGRTLHINNFHVDGLSRGACGLAGLNAIARKLLEVADVEQLIIQGAARTTGANPGKSPKPFRFPRC